MSCSWRKCVFRFPLCSPSTDSGLLIIWSFLCPAFYGECCLNGMHPADLILCHLFLFTFFIGSSGSVERPTLLRNTSTTLNNYPCLLMSHWAMVYVSLTQQQVCVLTCDVVLGLNLSSVHIQSLWGVQGQQWTGRLRRTVYTCRALIIDLTHFQSHTQFLGNCGKATSEHFMEYNAPGAD